MARNSTPKKSTTFSSHLIPLRILLKSVHSQSQSGLCRLAPEIRNRILNYATAQTREKVCVSLTCKLLARELPKPIHSSELPRQVDKTSASAQITKRVNFMTHLEDYFNEISCVARAPHDMLQGASVSWARRVIKKDWRLCSVCLVFKNATVINPKQPSAQVVVEIVDMSDEWHCVKKRAEKGGRGEEVGDRKMWICPKHKIDAVKMVQLRDK